ncbi:MAG TPA: L,D-transpeptidase [Candidatus Angelobacter sp.]|jgi:hypothetical protein|nr:L,D-transpeptidase [Candidatus Angelobacter sp.]
MASIIQLIALVSLVTSAPIVDQADHILVVKSQRLMTLMHGAKVLKTYKVALGTVPTGAKCRL